MKIMPVINNPNQRQNTNSQPSFRSAYNITDGVLLPLAKEIDLVGDISAKVVLRKLTAHPCPYGKGINLYKGPNSEQLVMPPDGSLYKYFYVDENGKKFVMGDGIVDSKGNLFDTVKKAIEFLIKNNGDKTI